MGIEPSAPSTANMKSCRDCAEPINEKAKKCIHCSSYQDWRAYFSFSATVLSMLVALVAVLTAAIPVAKDALTPKNSHLIFAYQGSRATTIAILASNQGARPGSVIFAKMNIGQLLQDISLIVSDFPAVIIEPGKSVLLEFHVAWAPKKQVDEEEAINTRCLIHVVSIDFAGTANGDDVTVSCTRLVAFVSNVVKTAAAQAN